MQSSVVKEPVNGAGAPSRPVIRGTPPPPDPQAELLRLWRMLFDRWPIVAAVTLVTVIAAAIYCFRTTPLYRASALIEVAPAEQTVARIEDVTKEALNQLDVLNTLVIKSTRPEVFRRVAGLTNVAQHPALRRHGKAMADDQLVALLAGTVKSQLRRSTRLLEITAIHPDPTLAQLLANGVASQFIRLEIDDRAGATRAANASLLEEADHLKTRLEGSERKLQAYREDNRSVSLDERLNLVAQKLQSLSQQLVEARAERAQIANQHEQALRLTNDVLRLLAMPGIRNDSLVAELLKQKVQQETVVNLFTTRYYEKYPKMIEARKRLDEISSSLAKAAVAAVRGLESLEAAARTRESGFENAVREAEKDSLALSRLAIEYNILHREMESDRNLYQSVLNRLKETNVSKGIEKTSLSLIEQAVVPSLPFRPQRPLILGLGLLGGLFVGLAVAFVLGQLDDSLKSGEEAEKRLGLPVIAGVPISSNLARSGKRRVNADAVDSVAESFRSLRASLGMMTRPENRQVVLVTSSVASEGKTTVAVNYAVALAQQGISTLLVDLDLRCPMVAREFGFPRSPGVTDCLLGESTIAAAVRPTDLEHLHVLAAGAPVPNPAEQLAGEELVRLLDSIRRSYQVVVIDSAPVLAVADSLHVLALAQMVLMVVALGETPFSTVQKGLTILQRARCGSVGLIVNRLARSYDYYDRRYAYRYAGR